MAELPSSQQYGATDSERQSPAEKASLLNTLVILARNKRLLVGVPAGFGLIALVLVLLMPKWYAATARIMPPQQSQSTAVALLGQLGALAAGAGQPLGFTNPGLAMLKSRTIADILIQQFDLKSVYDVEYFHDARKELASNTTFNVDRQGVISIEVEDKDPLRAAAIANAYVQELRGLTVLLAVSEASQRRLFFEGQLKKSKDDLSRAETELRKFTQGAGLVSPQGQIGVTVAAAAALRAQIAARDVLLSAMRSFATEDNPDLKRTQQELAGLKAELSKMEKDANVIKGDILVPIGKASEVGLEYVRRYRDMKYFETLYEVLARQYEIARIDEAKDATLIQVLDVALPPEKKSKPKRFLIVFLSVLVGAMAAVAAALTRESLHRAMQDANRGPQLRTLIQLLSPRS